MAAHKIKFSIKDFFSKCDQIRRFPADLVTFTEEIIKENFIFYVVSSTLNDELVENSVPFFIKDSE